MDKKREVWVDAGKGWAIIFVVFAHMFRGFSSAKMFSEYNFSLAYIDFTIYSFTIPLFLAMSGFLYAKFNDIHTFGDYKRLTFKKVINIAIPYFVFSIIQSFIKIFFASSINNPPSIIDLFELPFRSIDQFWFLYTLFSIYVLLPLFELIIKNTKAMFVFLMILLLASPYVDTSIDIIDCFMDSAFYFYFGKILFEYFRNITYQLPHILGLLLFYGLLNITVFSTFYLLIDKPELPSHLPAFLLDLQTYCSPFIKSQAGKTVYEVVKIFVAFSGTIFSIALIQMLTNAKLSIGNFLSSLGKYSFEIYILHVIFCAGLRVIIIKFFKLYDGSTAFAVHTILGFAFGTFLPVAIGAFSKKFPILHGLFYPTRYLFKKKTTIPQTTP